MNLDCILSGRLGDVFHALYVVYYRIQECGGPSRARATLYVSQDRRYGGEPFSKDYARTLAELTDFVAQWCPYVSAVIPLPDGQNPPPNTLNLNQWRTIHGRTDWITSLSKYYNLTSLNLPTTPAWCFPASASASASAPPPPPPPPREKGPYAVIHRSLVRHNPECPWPAWLCWLNSQQIPIYFITAAPEEYEAFPWKHLLTDAAYQPCPTLCEMAAWIYHATWFLGNQSSPLAMAVALGKPVIAELNPNLLDGICYMNSTMSEGHAYWFYHHRRHHLPPGCPG